MDTVFLLDWISLTAQGFAFREHGVVLRGWTLATQGQSTEGITQMHQGLSALQTGQ